MLIEKLAQFWSVSDQLPAEVDVISFAGFGATKDRLTRGAQESVNVGQDLLVHYPNARVVFGVFTCSPDPSLEERAKKDTFKDAIFVGDVISTIEEAEKIRATFPPDFVPRGIIFVTDEWHSRSAKLVWRNVWKDVVSPSNVRIVTIPARESIDEESPMVFGRRHWTWALVNVLRHLFLVCVPGSMWLMKKFNIHQP